MTRLEQEVMRDPHIVAETGLSYEKSAIVQWLQVLPLAREQADQTRSGPQHRPSDQLEIEIETSTP